MPSPPRLLISMNYHVDLWGRRGQLSARNLAQWSRELEAIRDLGCHVACLNIVRWEDRDGPGPAAYDPLDSLDRLLDLVIQQGLTPELMCNQWYGGPRLIIEDHVRAWNIDRQPLAALNWHEPAWRTEQLDPYLRALTTRFASRCPSVIYMFGDDLATPNTSYGPRDAARFRDWLARHYANVATANRAWGTAHESWQSVEPPRLLETWTPFWADWCAARRDWMDDCAHGIAALVREHDPRTRSTSGGARQRPGGANLSRIHFALMAWYLFADRDSWGGVSQRFLEPFDIVSTSANFPEETWPLEDALEWMDRYARAFRSLRPNQTWGLNDTPAPRGGRVGEPVEIYPSPARMIAIFQRAVELGAGYLQYDGYTKSLRQTAVANHQVLKFHPHLAREMKAFFKSVNA